MPTTTRSSCRGSTQQRQRCAMMLAQRSLAVLFIVNVPIATCVQFVGTPDFQKPMENVTVSQGREATFVCTVNKLGGHRVSSSSSSASGDQGYFNPRVAWIKADTKAILAIHEHVITNNARLSVTHNDQSTWTLVIKNAKPEDRGTYMCQVNTDPMKSQSAYLEVVIPPDIISEETTGDVMVPEGGKTKLVCKAKGYPQPKIEWKREDNTNITVRGENKGVSKKTVATGEVLNFESIKRSEMGGYLCIASNGVPPSVSKRMMLQVHFRPLIEVSNQLVGSPIRTNVTLKCKVQASPKPINYWTRESGEMIINNEKYEMYEELENLYTSRMTLVIRSVHKRDFMGYKCISKNSLGDVESLIRLYEIKLSQHKGEHSGGSLDNDFGGSSDEDNGNHLNHVYQSSLQESGSTSQPRSDSDYSAAGVPSTGFLQPLLQVLALVLVWTIA